MRGPEAKFWAHIRRRLRGQWSATRVENRLGSGTSDVVFSAWGKTGLIELKALEREPPRRINLPRTNHFTPEQATFLEDHGRHGSDLCWLLIRLGDRVAGVHWSLVRRWRESFPPSDLANRVSFILPYPIAPERLLRNVTGARSMPFHIPRKLRQ